MDSMLRNCHVFPGGFTILVCAVVSIHLILNIELTLNSQKAISNNNLKSKI